MKQIEQFLARWNWWAVAYNGLWLACFTWFIWYAFASATAPQNQNAGFWKFAEIMIIGTGPMYLIWIAKRVVTGRWLG